MSWRTRPAAVRERAVLAVGFLSAGALAAAALVPWGDPELAGGVELQRRGAEAADLVRLGWDRMLRDPAPPARSAGASLRWDTGQLAEPVRVSPIDKNRRSGGLVAFDGLESLLALGVSRPPVPATPVVVG